MACWLAAWFGVMGCARGIHRARAPVRLAPARPVSGYAVPRRPRLGDDLSWAAAARRLVRVPGNSVTSAWVRAADAAQHPVSRSTLSPDRPGSRSWPSRPGEHLSVRPPAPRIGPRRRHPGRSGTSASRTWVPWGRSRRRTRAGRVSLQVDARREDRRRTGHAASGHHAHREQCRGDRHLGHALSRQPRREARHCSTHTDDADRQLPGAPHPGGSGAR